MPGDEASDWIEAERQLKEERTQQQTSASSNKTAQSDKSIVL